MNNRPAQVWLQKQEQDDSGLITRVGIRTPEYLAWWAQHMQARRAAARKCGVTCRQSGKPCGNIPSEGNARCYVHTRRKSDYQSGYVGKYWARRRLRCPESQARASRREYGRLLQAAWRRDPWTPGQTIELDQGGMDYITQTLRDLHGLTWDQISPRTKDRIMWAYHGMVECGRGTHRSRLLHLPDGEEGFLRWMQMDIPWRVDRDLRSAPLEVTPWI
jgi:hypothetical protein